MDIVLMNHSFFPTKSWTWSHQKRTITIINSHTTEEDTCHTKSLDLLEDTIDHRIVIDMQLTTTDTETTTTPSIYLSLTLDSPPRLLNHKLLEQEGRPNHPLLSR